MRRPDPVTKDDVVAAAAELFQQRGFQNTRADDIADALQIAKPTLYSRTAGKGELLEIIYERVIESLEEDVARLRAEHVTPLEALEHLFRHHVQEAVQYRSFFAVVFMDERELPVESRTRVRKWGERYTRRVQDLVKEGIADGSIDPGLDPKVAAHTILAAANWVCVWFNDSGRLSADLIAEQSWRLLAGGLRGGTSPP